MYFKPKTVIVTFHSVPSAQPRSSTGPDLLPRVFCWKFCASGTCSVILGQQAAGPWQRCCCNRNISKQRWLETHRNEAWKSLSQQKLELFHSALPRPRCSPSSRFLTEKEGQDSQLLEAPHREPLQPFMLPACPDKGRNGGNSALQQFWHRALSGLLSQYNTIQLLLQLLHPLLRSTSEPQMGTSCSSCASRNWS